jgi:hypothetical protein
MNPKFKEFLEANKEMTMIGLGWALFWRLYAVILGVCVGLAILGELLG